MVTTRSQAAGDPQLPVRPKANLTPNPEQGQHATSTQTPQAAEMEFDRLASAVIQPPNTNDHSHHVGDQPHEDGAIRVASSTPLGSSSDIPSVTNDYHPKKTEAAEAAATTSIDATGDDKHSIRNAVQHPRMVKSEQHEGSVTAKTDTFNEGSPVAQVSVLIPAKDASVDLYTTMTVNPILNSDSSDKSLHTKIQNDHTTAAPQVLVKKRALLTLEQPDNNEVQSVQSPQARSEHIDDLEEHDGATVDHLAAYGTNAEETLQCSGGIPHGRGRSSHASTRFLRPTHAGVRASRGLMKSQPQSPSRPGDMAARTSLGRYTRRLLTRHKRTSRWTNHRTSFIIAG